MSVNGALSSKKKVVLFTHSSQFANQTCRFLVLLLTHVLIKVFLPPFFSLAHFKIRIVGKLRKYSISSMAACSAS